MKIQLNQRLSPLTWLATNGTTVTIPDSAGRFVNLQFSRFAGCPICNIHLASYRRKAAELEQAGIRVVVVFHSPTHDVDDLRGDLPFALVADPDRRYFHAFGVGQSPLALFNSRAFQVLRSEARQGRRAQRIHGGPFGLPADFVIDPQGSVIAAHYGRHADDTLVVNEVLGLVARQASNVL